MGAPPDVAATLNPSACGKLEITDLLNHYFQASEHLIGTIGRGYACLDTGTNASLLGAANFVRTLIERQSQQVGSPDEIAYEMGFIDAEALRTRAELFKRTYYGRYLSELV